MLSWQAMRWISMIFILFLLINSTGYSFLSAKKQSALRALENNADQTLEKIKIRLEETPESSLEESLSLLNQILDYAESVKKNPQQFNEQQLEAYHRKISIINANMERFKDLTLQTDISFAPGAYRLEELSQSAKEVLMQLVEKVAITVQELQHNYPDYPLRITVKTVGYTDATPFISGTVLEREIQAQLTSLAPTGIARRMQYNEILSQFRAESLNRYFITLLKQQINHGDRVDILPKIIGRGEQLPHSNQQDTYSEQDDRRRITIVSPFIEVML
ncbi:hypothetical protein [Thioflexithrix psekupsensis]|uniref:OmpA-like domain-containing protein n=1 Tax=Thioflexithrix psekupsensis TaxID=1570016 RepID=A0A251XC76_9GAMM|nr:hypothetical protein [Thioflexithrix psekupsensis]OUD15646.1 hypothetical protein TPSD3_03760 [Thioflexithrix psekupsensis]